MPSTYSPLKIQLMATGENNTTWGDVTNLNLGTAIEEAIVGSADVTFASGDVTLTLTDTNASQTARNMRLRCTGTTGGARNLVVPSIEKPYIVKNDCADSVTVKTAAGTGIAVPAGKTMWVYSDGTNVVDAVTHLSSLTLGTDLSVADGGTGASTFTANGVLYGNGASALQVTAAGTTGQVLVGNTGSAPSWATLTSSAVTSISFGSTGLTPSTPTQGAVTVAGTLGVANGGTGTATQFTAGSVVFAGASGVYTQDNAQLFWDNANDRLGIGTATPGAKLSVVGTAKIGEGAASNSAKLMVNTVSGAAAGIQLFQDGNESWVIENPASTTALTFANSGTERMRITGAGNVGIGTTSPGFTLEVSGTQRIAKAGAGYEASMLSFSTISETGAIYRMGMASGGNFIIGRSDTATTNITLDSSGNVGIGTTAPNALLTVSNGGAAGYEVNPTGGVGGGATVATYNRNTLAYTSLTTYSSTMTWYANGTTRAMDLDSSGRLMVGITGALNNNMISAYGTNQNGFVAQVTNNIYSNFQGFNASTVLTFGVDGSGNGYFAGNVGIGTLSPSYALDVSATGNISGQFKTSGSINALYLADAGTTAGSLYIGTVGNDFRVVTGSSERMRVTSTGPVLIGLTSAYQVAANATNLQIGDPITTAGAGISLGANTTNDIAFADNTTGAGQYAGLIRYSHTSDFMALWTASTERMRIDASGNVLVGATGGGSAGLAVGVGLNISFAETTGQSYATIYRQASSGGLILGSGVAYTSTPNGFASSTSAAWARSAVGVMGGGIKFYTAPTATVAVGTDTTLTERMFIDSAGDVGIGTTSPAQRLDVTVSSGTEGAGLAVTNSLAGGYGSGVNFYSFRSDGTTKQVAGSIQMGGQENWSSDATVSSFMRFLTVNDNTLAERMRIDSSGNVGIGTTAPKANTGYATLTLNNASNGGVVQFTQADTTIGQLFFDGNGGTLRSVSNTPLVFGTNNTERMRITSAGNLQLGTASLATTATDGFPYIPTCAGTPTGTPTAITGYAPMVVDSTNNKLYVYVGGAWQAMN